MSMWIITERGEFLSEVTSRDGTHRVIRARDKKSIRGIASFLEALRDLDGIEEPVEVIEGAGTDYWYRVNCSHDEWTQFVTSRAETGTGTNHKNAVADALGKDKGRGFLRAMMETWSIWYSYQEAELRKKGKS
jgi:hypothetical protein